LRILLAVRRVPREAQSLTFGVERRTLARLQRASRSKTFSLPVCAP
jgi:hypothetical protein